MIPDQAIRLDESSLALKVRKHYGRKRLTNYKYIYKDKSFDSVFKSASFTLLYVINCGDLIISKFNKGPSIAIFLASCEFRFLNRKNF